MRPLVVLVALAGVARADLAPGEVAVGRAPLLRIELDATDNAKEPSLVDVKVRAFVLVAPGGKTLWRRAPPAYLAMFTGDRRLVAAYRRDRHAPLEAIGWPFAATATRADGIVVFVSEQFLVFARADGKLLHEETVGEAGFGALNYKRADVTADCAGRRVTRRVDAGRFLIDCGSRLVYGFVQGIYAFKTDSYARAGTVMFPDVSPQLPRHEFKLEGVTVTIVPIDSIEPPQ